ncbi:MAG TPA: FliM/FliN family flagellar motor switch protein [Anaerohalosphaeraceae bacterium]|nr:FliM/FliN family flagellar motor switch protein [Phycisphaerae bacterium]HOK95037.1 FliM/FliN family flagellar motor switch protein [Anaerohalosphaeraceae bacterium]HOL30348.1 FliM/FliN family flagellar motor switch protein [Anaerohalosphaeraceae bacterium]HOM76724.1 FliM/FliN family flagellar motor switch protein [Anaerohalosphaeraceae bacterium]HPC63046.1 FliM/FliN family flagellar motor switch protein [Anaerohalosphaeraceae bacterium]
MSETAVMAEEKKAEQPEDALQAEQSVSPISVQSVEFTNVEEKDAAGTPASLDILLDMEVPITVAIGQADISIQRLLQLGPGSVVKLDKTIDAPAELYLKDTLFALGDIVAADGQFAVRIRDIIGPRNPSGKSEKTKKS